MKRESPWGFKRNIWAIPELDSINKAAYWDYQRERVLLRSNARVRRAVLSRKRRPLKIPINQIVQCSRPRRCPRCASARIVKHVPVTKLVYDLKFTSSGVKRWVVRYDFYRYICQHCQHTFNWPIERRGKFGSELVAHSVYQMIEMRVPVEMTNRIINRLFGLQLPANTTQRFKEDAAAAYTETYDAILGRLKSGTLIHADETKVSLRDSDAFVWVFTSMEEVAYVFAETREATPMQTLLKDFKGILVSDFFAAYEEVKCPQQKCLVHLIRDLNEALHRNPFDEELKRLAARFTDLLHPMVQTVDRFGLKRRFLRKHRVPVARFFKGLQADELQSETAVKPPPAPPTHWPTPPRLTPLRTRHEPARPDARPALFGPRIRIRPDSTSSSLPATGSLRFVRRPPA